MDVVTIKSSTQILISNLIQVEMNISYETNSACQLNPTRNQISIFKTNCTMTLKILVILL